MKMGMQGTLPKAALIEKKVLLQWWSSVWQMLWVWVWVWNVLKIGMRWC
jgi:hypothetical protein